MKLTADKRRRSITDERCRSLDASFRVAKDLHAAGRLNEAAAGYEVLIRIAPDYLEASYSLGLVRLQQQSYEEAAKIFRRLVARDGNSSLVHLNLATALRGMRQWDAAATHYARAARCEPASPAAHIHCAAMWSEARHTDKANRSIDLALAIHCTQAEALNDLGNVLKSVGRHEEALRAYDRALESMPGSAAIHCNRGIALFELRRFDEALVGYDAALSADPNYVQAIACRGGALVALERHEESIEALRNASTLLPGDAIIHYNLGNALKELGRSEEALASYDRAVQLDASLAIAYNNRGDVLAELGRFDEARVAFETAIAADPGNTIFYVNLTNGKTFAANDPLIDRMETRLDEMAGAPPCEDSARLHYALGKALSDCGEHERAFEHYLAGARTKRSLIDYDEATVMTWFDRIETTFTQTLVQRLGGGGDPSARPIFVLGMPRSGSTLIEQILASHTGVHGAGELPYFGMSTDWLAMALSAREIGIFPEMTHGLSGEDLKLLGRAYLTMTDELTSGRDRVIDKQPSNFLFLGLIHLALPNARIIHIERDPIDTCVSCFSTLFSDFQSFSYDLGELGRFYRRYHQLMAHWRSVLPQGAFLDLKYEALVADTGSEARRVLDYCGLPWDDACLRFHTTKRPVRTASVNQVRQPIYSKAIGKWRRYQAYLSPLIDELPVSVAL